MPSSPKPEKMDMPHQPNPKADAVRTLNAGSFSGQSKTKDLTVSNDLSETFEVTEDEIQMILNHLGNDIHRIINE